MRSFAEVAQLFRQRTGLEPQAVTLLMRGEQPRDGVTVWSVMTANGAFYVTDDGNVEIFRRDATCRGARQARRRHLERRRVTSPG
ncbi:MAG TPA: hypothetical protein VIN09_05505 [Chloroflexota bacterium]